MSLTLIVIIVIAAVVIIYLGLYFSYNNRDINLRKEADAQRQKIESTYDKMWKTLSKRLK